MTEKMKPSRESTGRYQVRYKTLTFCGRTKNEALAARNYYILDENSDAAQYVKSRLEDGYSVTEVPWPFKKARPM